VLGTRVVVALPLEACVLQIYGTGNYRPPESSCYTPSARITDDRTGSRREVIESVESNSRFLL
jgi:hypothetical protein